MKSTEWYVSDFETTDYKYYQENGYTRVWLYAICDKDSNIINYGSSIDEWFIYIRKLYGKSIYFHNLKFDGQFIIDYLVRHGYEYHDKLTDYNRGFSVLIGDMGESYSITIKFTKGKQVHIYDSLKLLPFKVEKIARDFELPMLKGKIDYSDYTIDINKLEYVFNDVKIVAGALRTIKAEGMNKMTTASCAYSEYVGMKSEQFLYNALPDLDDDFLTEWRAAYRGGRCQVSPLYQGKKLHNVKRYDINSMYPYIMSALPLPYGLPRPITEMGKYNFELYHMFIEFQLKDYRLPSLLKKSGLYTGDDTYYIDSEGIIELWISNIDFELLQRNYDISYLEIIDMYGFVTSTLMFFDYVGKWYEKKNNDKGAKKIVDKLMLNSLYGKFGSNFEGRHKIPYLDEETNTVRYKNSEKEQMKKYYLPIAIAITSWAHKLIDDAIYLSGSDNFVYCDTDSVHTLGSLPNEMVDSKILGKFKLEGIEDTCKYVRQKCYVYKEKENMTITCAGMTENMKQMCIEKYGDDLFKVFKDGFTIGGKLLPKRVPGGTVLYETQFTIR